MDSTVLLSSSLLVGLVSAVITIRVGERKIQIENITAERAKWREQIRKLSFDVHQSTVNNNGNRLGELVQEFSLRINPFDEEDLAIPKLIYRISVEQDKSALLLEFRKELLYYLNMTGREQNMKLCIGF